jgi:ribose transport system ATP-binding protein
VFQHVTIDLSVPIRELSVAQQQFVAMIFISHHVEEIFEVCDRITVLRDGQQVGMTEVSQSDVGHLVEMMVGRHIENSFPPKSPLRADAKIVLEVDKLQLLKDSPMLSFTLREGVILGFVGLVGSGRTELVRTAGDRRHVRPRRRVPATAESNSPLTSTF